ncbi:MAG: phosphate acyltransferase [Planctomycetota bacterium]
MDVLLELHEKARRLARPRRTARSLRRARRASRRVAALGLCRPVLVAAPAWATRCRAASRSSIHAATAAAETFAKELEARRRHKERLEGARKQLQDPLSFGAALVAWGDCHSGVAGSFASTADVLRAALSIIGMQEGLKTVSSCFLMVMADRAYTYGDCGVVPDPDMARGHRDRHRREPRAPPGRNPRSRCCPSRRTVPPSIRGWTRCAATEGASPRPGPDVDGELQVDAAIVPKWRNARCRAPPRGPRECPDFPRFGLGQHRLQAHAAPGGREGDRALIRGLARPFMDLSPGLAWTTSSTSPASPPS